MSMMNEKMFKFQTINKVHYAYPNGSQSRTLCRRAPFPGKAAPDFVNVTCTTCLLRSPDPQDRSIGASFAKIKDELEHELYPERYA